MNACIARLLCVFWFEGQEKFGDLHSMNKKLPFKKWFKSELACTNLALNYLRIILLFALQSMIFIFEFGNGIKLSNLTSLCVTRFRVFTEDSTRSEFPFVRFQRERDICFWIFYESSKHLREVEKVFEHSKVIQKFKKNFKVPELSNRQKILTEKFKRNCDR